MARRGGSLSIRCTEPGCGEFSFISYTSQRDLAEHTSYRNRATWKCLKHEHPEQQITRENNRREVIATALRHTYIDKPSGEQRTIPNKLFWYGDGVFSSGVIHGPGFRSEATDFPEGTQLKITVEVILPDGSNH